HRAVGKRCHVGRKQGVRDCAVVSLSARGQSGEGPALQSIQYSGAARMRCRFEPDPPSFKTVIRPRLALRPSMFPSPALFMRGLAALALSAVFAMVPAHADEQGEINRL